MAVEACTVAMLAVAHEPDMRGSVLTFDGPQRGTVLPAHLQQSSKADRIEISPAAQIEIALCSSCTKLPSSPSRTPCCVIYAETPLASTRLLQDTEYQEEK